MNSMLHAPRLISKNDNMIKLRESNHVNNLGLTFTNCIFVNFRESVLMKVSKLSDSTDTFSRLEDSSVF